MNTYKLIITTCFLLVKSFSLVAQSIPTQFNSESELNEFLSKQPQFKCNETSIVLTLTYSFRKYTAFINNKELGQFEVDLNRDYLNKALIGLPWLNGYGPAPMLLTLDGDKTYLALLPVEGAENLSFNNRGYLQPGLTGQTTWMKLSLGLNGISFTPVDSRPNPQMFYFIGYSEKKLTNQYSNTIFEKKDLDKEPEFPGGPTEFENFLENNLIYPYSNELILDGIRRDVHVTVRKDGTIKIIETTSNGSVSDDFTKEAERLVKLMPNFIPGRIGNDNVNCNFTITIPFKISKEKKKILLSRYFDDYFSSPEVRNYIDIAKKYTKSKSADAKISYPKEFTKLKKLIDEFNPSSYFSFWELEHHTFSTWDGKWVRGHYSSEYKYLVTGRSLMVDYWRKDFNNELKKLMKKDKNLTGSKFFISEGVIDNNSYIPKDKAHEGYLVLLFNEFNDKIYNYLILQLFGKKGRSNDIFSIPQSINDVDISDYESFEDFFSNYDRSEKVYLPYGIDNLETYLNDSYFKDNFTKWKDLYFLRLKGKSMNGIYNQSGKRCGKFTYEDKWQSHKFKDDWQSHKFKDDWNEHTKKFKGVNFNTLNPYSLYFLQNDEYWSNIITIIVLESY